MEGRMFPKWQIVGLMILAMLLMGLSIYSSPNSFANLFFTGKCDQQPMPAACRPHRRAQTD
jgi:hypothetical protein